MDRRLPLLAAACHPLVVWAFLTRWGRTNLYIATYDDFFRVQHAWESAHGAVFPAELWPPLPFWITGAVLRVWPDGRLVPGLCAEAFTVVGLAALGLAAMELGLSAFAAAASVVFAGMLPWVLNLAPSALAEPFANGLLLVGLAAGVSRRPRLAIVAAALAGMCRYEVWVVAPVLFVFGWVARWPRRWLGVPLVFPVVWLVLEWAWTGNPFFFGAEAQTGMEVDHPTGWLGAIPGDVTAAVGPLFLFALAGLSVLPARAWPVVSAGLLYLVVLIVADMLGFAGLHNVPRTFVLPAMLLAIPAAALVDRVPGRLRVGALALVLAIAAGEWRAQTEPPQAFDPELARLGDRLRSVLRELPAGERVLIEAIPMEAHGLAIAGGDLSRVVNDRDLAGIPLDREETADEARANPSVLDRSLPELSGSLRTLHVRAVLARSPSRVAKLVSLGKRDASRGGWTLVVLPQ